MESEQQLFVEIPAKIAGTECRDATADEIKQATELRKKLTALHAKIKKLKTERDKLLKGCEHKVCYDEAGYMYDSRNCFACGKLVGFI